MHTIYNFRTPHELEDGDYSFSVQVPTHVSYSDMEKLVCYLLGRFKIAHSSISECAHLDVHEEGAQFEHLFHRMFTKYLVCSNLEEKKSVYKTEIVSSKQAQDILKHAFNFPDYVLFRMNFLISEDTSMFTFQNFVEIMKKMEETGIDPRVNPPIAEAVNGYKIICDANELKKLHSLICNGAFKEGLETEKHSVEGIKHTEDRFDIDKISLGFF